MTEMNTGNVNNKIYSADYETKVAVVILNWNGRKILEEFLPSVIKNTVCEQTKIVIADNGSTDDSLEFLLQNFPGTEQIILDRNYGFAGGYNRALEKISAKYFVLLNSDVEVTENWLAPLISHLDENDNVAACMPKILSYRQKTHFEYAGAAGGYIDRYGYPFCRGRILNSIEIDEKQYDMPVNVFWAAGACMIVRSEIYNRLKGFDEDFFAHMEEIDLCWRIQHAGYSLACIPQSAVFHLGGGTLETDNPKKIYLNFRNNLFMLVKNLPEKKFKRTVFARLALDFFSAAVFLVSLKLTGFAAVIKAHFHFYKSIGILRKKRREILEFSKISEVPNMYGKSILLKFFKSGKKLKFSDIQDIFGK
ncbi:MAG: glycosyltransferase family 2 protein [Prevotellaceae bacterium]|jgi:GT2 family glycosyltransferase|nr:glycosyltransferase family 2 protein [Prevotellaceae bacterium]